MLVLTFDNAAVQSLKAKLVTTLEAHSVEPNRFQVSTLNSFGYCVKIRRSPTSTSPSSTDNGHGPWCVKFVRAFAARMPNVRPLCRTTSTTGSTSNFFAFLDPRQFAAQELVDFILKARQAEPFFQPTFDQPRIKFIIQAILWLFRSFEAVYQREGRIDFDDQKLRALMCLRAATRARSDPVTIHRDHC